VGAATQVPRAFQGAARSALEARHEARMAFARRHRSVANRRKNRNNQITAGLVRAHKLIVTEELAPSNMTASARGTAEKPGRNVKAKAGLNRAILDATHGSFLPCSPPKRKKLGAD
jgi:putative transposase